MKVLLESRLAPDGRVNWSLTIGKTYEVLGIECSRYRLLDDCNEPFLFEPECFRIVDETEPSHWLSFVEDGERYAYPPEWNRPGFFEDWHDGVPEVCEAFWRQLAERYPETAAVRRSE